MKFLLLILRNAFRNRRRTILTVLSISMSMFLISTLRTLLTQLESPALTQDSATRMMTRRETGLGDSMPISYRDRIRVMPGVEEVTAYQWVGGTYKDPQNFFAQFAVDADRFFAVYPDIHVAGPEQLEAFKKERTAALAGVSIAKKYGWKIGDRVTLEGTFFPTVEPVVRGFIKDSGSESLFILHWDYLNEIAGDAFHDRSGVFVVKVKSPDQVAAISGAIDDGFANSTAPTKTETEKAFVLGFVSMLGNINTLIVSISTVLIFTIILVTANSMAMSIRERTGEIAILKTLGFSPGQVLSVLIAEAALIGVLGGLVGSVGGRYLWRFVDFNSVTTGFIQVFNVDGTTILLACVIALVVALASTAVPAWSASRLAIADAVRRRGE